MRRRLDSLLISAQAFDAAMQGDYKAFMAARAETLLAWANDLTGGQLPAEEPGTSDPEVILRGETVEVVDTSTDDQPGTPARHFVMAFCFPDMTAREGA